MQLKAPAALAVAVHSVAPLAASTTATVLAASAVPLSWGRCLRVGEGGESSTGGRGGVVSTTRSRSALGGDECPWPSLSCASRRYEPSASGAAGWQVQRPSAPAVVEQTGVSQTTTATSVPACAVPLSCGLGSRVGDGGTSKSGAISVRTLRGTGCEGPLLFPEVVTWNACSR